MLDQADIAEIALRGGAGGVNFLLAGLFLFSRPLNMRRLLGALFALGTAIYILVSAEDFNIFGPYEAAAQVIVIYNTVFFWWFARSLFEDEFIWDWLKLTPIAVLTVLHAPLEIWRTQNGELVEQALHGALSVLLLAHAVFIALRDRNIDLVDPRRRFRLVFAVMVGVAGIFITLGESLYAFADLPEALTLLHAGALFALTFFFAFWLLSLNRAFFAVVYEKTTTEAPAVTKAGAVSLSPADTHALEKLTALMNAGVYRQERLSVAALAGKVGVPEHQLRRLINRELGFRNFTAFLNVRRIEDAKAMLCEPENARRQVLQIALDLGYGSVAPFNRAFKDATGQTPTEYRKNAQENG